MATFVAGSHELSPSINYLLHNKILSGQISSNSNQNSDNNNGLAAAPTPVANNHSIYGNTARNILTSPSQPARNQYENFHQISTIPPIKGQSPIKSQSPPDKVSALTVKDYEDNYRDKATDLELVERVFYGGMASNKLRAALWPYLFGLVKQRGRFRLIEDSDGNPHDYVYIEHEANVKRWQELEKLFYSYQSQWRSIKPDQELRFSTFRERKSLIERDIVRTDRTHPFYADNSQNLNSFTTLLMTYMMYDFDIGYLQGMSDLAAPILFIFNGDLVKSFWVFVEVMKLFRRNFEFSQKTIHFQLRCLYRLIKITDPKFATYLNENECSNCFFAFRCIVCQFKRELMKSDNHDDYTKVLSLWDIIWSVQRRQELLSKSKYVHTFTIANRYSGQHNKYRHYRQSYKSSPTQANGRNKSNVSPNITSNGHTNGYNNNSNTNVHSRSQRYSDGLSCSYSGINKVYHKQLNSSPMKSNGSSSSLYDRNGLSNGNGIISSNGHSSPASNNLKYTNGASPLSHSPVSINGHDVDQAAPVKQEQIVYTKETFYASFDPNQADVPRFELTETEKFVLSLCTSLIRKERDKIMSERLEASEIHQHFINKRLAEDLNSFIQDAYHIYHFLNTDCDIQLLVKGASELNLSPSEVDGPLGASPKASTADTYDLLRDYLIISPSSYNTSRYKYSVSQKSWDHFLNNNEPLAE